MNNILNGLTNIQRIEAEKFLSRLNNSEKENLGKIVNTIDNRAHSYYGDKWEHVIISDSCYFAVYGIGGNLTKEGRRPDIDMLVATNMWYSSSSDFEGYDALYASFMKELTPDFEITKLSNLPDDYNFGETQGKCLIRFTPKKNIDRKIDLVYVKCLLDNEIGSVEEFEKKDIDNKGNPLPKVRLYFSEQYKAQELHW